VSWRVRWSNDVSRTCYRAQIGKRSYTICYVICKLNDFRDAACPAAVAGFPIEGLENLICLRPKTVLMEWSLQGREVGERACRRQRGLRAAAAVAQQVLGCRYIS